MSRNKLTIEDIFNEEDEFNLLKIVKKVKTDEDRLIEAFEEINAFFDKNNREPNTSSLFEYGLLARLKHIRKTEDLKKILKPFDKNNLLDENKSNHTRSNNS